MFNANKKNPFGILKVLFAFVFAGSLAIGAGFAEALITLAGAELANGGDFGVVTAGLLASLVSMFGLLFLSDTKFSDLEPVYWLVPTAFIVTVAAIFMSSTVATALAGNAIVGTFVFIGVAGGYLYVVLGGMMDRVAN